MKVSLGGRRQSVAHPKLKTVGQACAATGRLAVPANTVGKSKVFFYSFGGNKAVKKWNLSPRLRVTPPLKTGEMFSLTPAKWSFFSGHTSLQKPQNWQFESDAGGFVRYTNRGGTLRFDCTDAVKISILWVGDRLITSSHSAGSAVVKFEGRESDDVGAHFLAVTGEARFLTSAFAVGSLKFEGDVQSPDGSWHKCSTASMPVSVVRILF